MAKIISNAEQVLKEQYESYIDSTMTSFKEYVECESQSDTNFFRWLFGEDFDNDFDTDLNEEHKELFNEFVNSLSDAVVNKEASKDEDFEN